MAAARNSALEIVRSIRGRETTATDVVGRALRRIARREGEVGAWAFADPDLARDRAERLDRWCAEGGAAGPLHGVPIGVKDIIDTADMPTEYGTALHAGRRPDRDAAVVTLLRDAGAIIIGKTVTTEYALAAPGRTKNPHDLSRTPGGSSSGSAAAVAAGMVPVAVGTQTNGSIIRPASYCGVVGYKPTYGSISRFGVLEQSPPLDQIGVFGRTVQDVALLAQILMRFDGRDRGMAPFERPDLLSGSIAAPAEAPRFAFVRSPAWDQADGPTRAAFLGLRQALGEAAAEVTLPASFDDAIRRHRVIMEADVARALSRDIEVGGATMSARLREMIERGRSISMAAYDEALAGLPTLISALDAVFATFDVILTPAATGEAPPASDTTGSPAFCTRWTLCGVPTISLPLLAGENGLPVGVQLVGSRGGDAHLLAAAAWLMEACKPQHVAVDRPH